MQSKPEALKTDHADELTPRQQASFLSVQGIEKVTLSPATRLWRFNHLKTSKAFSPFWMTEDTMARLMSIINTRGDYGLSAKREIIKESMALLDSFGKQENSKSDKDFDRDSRNMAAWRMRIRIIKPLVAYIGQAAPQKEMKHDEEASEHFGAKTEKMTQHRMGGHNQVVIPRFANINESAAAEWAVIDYGPVAL